MGLAILEPLFAHDPWAVLVVLLLVLCITALKILGVKVACKGADSKDRADIIKALAVLFRSWWHWWRR